MYILYIYLYCIFFIHSHIYIIYIYTYHIFFIHIYVYIYVSMCIYICVYICVSMHIYICIWSEMKVAQSCPTLCNPMDYSVHGILQARILEWVDFPFSRGSSQPMDWTQVSSIAGKLDTTEWLSSTYTHTHAYLY